MEAREEDLREYVPEWNGNRDKPEAEQRAALGRDGKVSLKSAEAAIERIIKARVARLHNCKDILGQPIENGEGLWERAEQSLIDECYAALTEVSTLSEGMRKK